MKPPPPDWTPPPPPPSPPAPDYVPPPNPGWTPPPVAPVEQIPRVPFVMPRGLKIALIACPVVVGLFFGAYHLINREPTDRKLPVTSSALADWHKEPEIARDEPTPESDAAPISAIFSCPDSIYHIYIEERVRRSHASPFLTIKRRDDVIYSEHFEGEIWGVHWSPSNRYAAIIAMPDDLADGIRIVDLVQAIDLKSPMDGPIEDLIRLTEASHAQIAQARWGGRSVFERVAIYPHEWLDDVTYQIRVARHYHFGSSVESVMSNAPLRMTRDGYIHEYVEKELEIAAPPPVDEERALVEFPGFEGWTTINTDKLHETFVFSVHRESNLISFGMYWMERFGAIKQTAFVNDVDWSKAWIVEDIPHGAFAGATKIEIPLKADLQQTLLTWDMMPGYSVEAPPWSEGVRPAKSERTSEVLWIMAANRRAAEALVALFHKFRHMPESCKDSEAFDPNQPCPGERYPQTRAGLINAADFEHLSMDELRYAINEMYARHGALFGNIEVLPLFEGYAWYRTRPTVSFDDIEAGFTEHEKANLRILGRLREEKR